VVLTVPTFLRIHPEETMIFVTFRARAITADVVPEVCRRLRQLPTREHTTGWLRGECLIHANDPRDVLAYEVWATRQSWDTWFHSAAKDRLCQELQPLCGDSVHIEIWEEA
jgi:hypothetical protein